MKIAGALANKYAAKRLGFNGFKVPNTLFIMCSEFKCVISCQLAKAFTPNIICFSANKSSTQQLNAIAMMVGIIFLGLFFKNS